MMERASTETCSRDWCSAHLPARDQGELWTLAPWARAGFGYQREALLRKDIFGNAEKRQLALSSVVQGECLMWNGA